MKKIEQRYPECISVKCVVVDKYQGEENDIVLLSLVRSNKEGKIGFLGVSNRICVALSRAKKGLYLTGNIELLSRSKLWAEIKETLERKNAIGKNFESKSRSFSYIIEDYNRDQEFRHLKVTEPTKPEVSIKKLNNGF